jgi:hypothetical protein
MKMPVKIKFLLLFLLWLAGTMLLWTSNNKAPAIIISGGILLRSFIVETKSPEETKDKKLSN